MEDDQPIPRLIEALRSRDGIIKYALYSAALLYAMFPKANELIEDLRDQD